MKESPKKSPLSIAVLAAGKGKRMKTSIPKVLHQVCFHPLLYYVIKAAEALRPAKIVVVASDENKQEIEQFLQGKYQVVIQAEPIGTGDAVLRAEKALGKSAGDILVLNGDVPLLRAETLRELIRLHQKTAADATVLTAWFTEPFGYGRIVRTRTGQVEKIVEERDATAKEKKLGEINSGTYIFKASELFKQLKKLQPDNDQHEYYLTDVIEYLCNDRRIVQAMQIFSEAEVKGINTREELAEVDRLMRNRINRHFMLEGVSLADPRITYIDPEARIGRDTTILPMSFIVGKSVIGENCMIGPSSYIRDTRVGHRCYISFSAVSDSVILEDVEVGPFSRIRPGSTIEQGVKIGSYVEIKKTRVGKGSKIPHLSYIGDAEIGENVNVGAGSITCNYDGEKKHPTIVEDEVFLGSDTMLVAPVKIRKGAVTGAGSVITQDVPEGALGIGRGYQRNIEDWKKRKNKAKPKKESRVKK